jgi:hypothetical protein
MKTQELHAVTHVKESTSTFLPACLHMNYLYVSITKNIHLFKNSIFFPTLETHPESPPLQLYSPVSGGERTLGVEK